jgi:hypothetical protein
MTGTLHGIQRLYAETEQPASELQPLTSSHCE